MRHTAKELVEIFKKYPEDEVIFTWFSIREEFDGLLDISAEQWSEIKDITDWTYEYVSMAMFDLVCEKVNERGLKQNKLVQKSALEE